MMNNEKNIDKLFQEKLGGFSEEPPAFIWDGIQEQLAAGRRKKKIAWYSWSAVAALLVLAFLAGWYFNETTESLPRVAEKELINTDNEPISGSRDSRTEIFSNENKEDEKQQNTQFFAEAAGDASEKKKNQVKDEVFINAENAAVAKREMIRTPEMITPLEASFTAQFDVGVNNEAKNNVSEEVVGFSPSDREIIERNANLLGLNETKNTGWAMGMNISPGYSSYFARHSELYASNMTREAAENKANLSGGFSVRYRTSKRWSFESGVYYAQNGQQMNSSPQIFGERVNKESTKASAELLYFNTVVRMENNHVAMNSPAGIIELENLPVGAEISANLENDVFEGNSLITQGELSQVFDLVEIPFHLRFLLVDSDLDVELIGGINAGLIVGNNAYLDNQYGIQRIGRTRDISAMNISGTFGFGFNYALGKQFSLAMEPRLNYYLNSINKNPDVDFRPYRIGIYTGVYYSF